MMIEKNPNRIIVYKHLKGNQYVGYPINHRVKEYGENEYPSYYDNWGIGRLFLCTYQKTRMSLITTLFRYGEAELALNVPNSQDESKKVYVGGANHGFEVIRTKDNHRGVSITIDGHEYEEDDNITLSECSAINIEQNSLLYQAYSNSNPFAKVSKEWKFTDVDNLRISCKVELLRDIDISQGQYGMLCVYRHEEGDPSKKYLTNRAFKNNESIIYNVEDGWDDLSIHPENSSLRKFDNGCTLITEEGECGLSFALKILDATNIPNGGMFLGTNGSSYNKIYFDLTGYYSAKESEVLSAEVEWIIDGIFPIDNYKLTYEIDGEVYKSFDVEFGTIISPEEDLVKEGFSFSAWSEIPETMPAHDVTVTGAFTANRYKLIYVVDGTEYKSHDVMYGTEIAPEVAPVKEGHTFSGWSEIPETMPKHDVIVTGSFVINSYALTYLVDGEEYKSYEIDYGHSIIAEEEPTKEGYSFIGWSEIPETMPAYDFVVTGSFIVNTYTLTYMVDGEAYKTYEVDYGINITPETAPMKTGYSFSGWDEVPKTMPACNVTISGSFTINIYKLTYYVDNEDYKTFDIDYNHPIIAEEEPKKNGYTFSGWTEIPETMPASDVMVRGTFTINKYLISYIINGEVFATDSLEYETTIILPMVEEREGFSFSGWGEVPETMPAHDVVVYASYISGINKGIITQRNVLFYSCNGWKRNTLHKGLNIVKLGDGRVKVVMMK